MEVTIRVTRTMPDGTVKYFEGVATSIQGAIDAADQLATGVVATTTATTVVKTDAAGTTGKGDTAGKTNAADKKTEKKAEEEKSTAGNASPANGAGQETTAQKDDVPAVSYDAVKAAITEVATAKGRDLTLAMLSRFGVQSGKDLKPEQYAELVEKAGKVLDGSYDPMASEEVADELS